ncbi:hypothetical protein GMMP15_1000009 [Candidatus Magnetomoraceae bacterium gMMP-15]
MTYFIEYNRKYSIYDCWIKLNSIGNKIILQKKKSIRDWPNSFISKSETTL